MNLKLKSGRWSESNTSRLLKMRLSYGLVSLLRSGRAINYPDNGSPTERRTKLSPYYKENLSLLADTMWSWRSGHAYGRRIRDEYARNAISTQRVITGEPLAIARGGPSETLTSMILPTGSRAPGKCSTQGIRRDFARLSVVALAEVSILHRD